MLVVNHNLGELIAHFNDLILLNRDLELETTAEYKSEYRDGLIIPIAGGTPNHNQIAVNFSAALNFALKGQPYRVFTSDLRLWIPQA